MRRTRILSVLGFSVVVALVACSNTSSTGSHSGGTLVWAIPWDAASLDPDKEGEAATQVMMGLVYETLLSVDPTDRSKLNPGLAQSWSASDQNTVFTFDLFHNAKFSTGNPVTSADVVFSLERLQNLKANPSSIVATMQSADAVDPYTVRITTKAPDGAFLAKMSSVQALIFDSTVAKKYGGVSDTTAITADKLEPYFNALNTLGSGPFVLSKYLPNDEFEVVRNDKYWGTPPPLDKIVLKDIPDSATQQQLLENGGIDIAGSLDFGTAKQLEGKAGVSVSYAPAPQLIYMFMNTSPTVSPYFSNKLVRQAVQKTIDYTGLLQLASGHAQQPATTIPVGLLGADTVPAPKQDLATAKQLMAQAGYSDGFTVDFPYPNPIDFGIDLNQVAAKLQSDMAQIGIKLNLQPTSLIQFLTIYRTKKDAFGFSVMSSGYADPDQFVGSFWCSCVSGFSQRVNYVNPQIDQLYPQSLSTTGDARVQVYKQLQQIFQDDPVFIGLLQPQFVIAYRTRVHGLQYIWNQKRFDFRQVSVS